MSWEEKSKQIVNKLKHGEQLSEEEIDLIISEEVDGLDNYIEEEIEDLNYYIERCNAKKATLQDATDVLKDK